MQRSNVVLLPDFAPVELALSYKVILFDLDDTLVDFTAAEQKSLKIIHHQFYSSYVTEERFVETYHLVNKKLWKEVEEGQLTPTQVSQNRFKLIGETLRIPLETEIIKEIYESQLIKNTTWLPDVEETLVFLKRYFQLGVITNGLTKVQKGRYTQLNIGDWAEVYIISEEIGCSKPNKKIFDHTLRILQAQPEETLMVGDSLSSDYQGAINSKMDFCWINRHSLTLPIDNTSPLYTLNSIAGLPSALGFKPPF